MPKELLRLDPVKGVAVGKFKFELSVDEEFLLQSFRCLGVILAATHFNQFLQLL
jgi:hypothetical protein